MEKFGPNPPTDVLERIEIEYDVIIPNRFTDYILIVADIHDFCRDATRILRFCNRKGLEPPTGDGTIALGPGRGSVGGSMVCYLLGITQCDPLLFGLFFERFLNPERIAYPDIDFDISQKYRHIGIAYIADTYGEDMVAQIITYGTLSKNMVIHDIMQSANVPNYMINMVKDTIPDDPAIELSDIKDDERFLNALRSVEFPPIRYEVNRTNVADLLQSPNKMSDSDYALVSAVATGSMPTCTVTIQSSWNWEKLLYTALKLEGLNKNESKHAAGVVIAPVRLDEHVPLMQKVKKNAKDGVNTGMACQYEATYLEAIGYLKMDVLGLRTVDVNHDAELLVQKWYDPDFKLANIRYDDKQAIDLINAGDNNGIFQIESSGFTQMMKELNIGGYEVQRFSDRDESRLTSSERSRGLEIADFMWISAGLALYRPGPLDAVIEGKTMVQHLIDRKAGREPVIYLFPEEKSYLEETYGVLVYQEQVMSRVRQMTGCSYGRADILRKAMGKKDPVLMQEQMNWFKENAMTCVFSADPRYEDQKFKQQIVDRAAEEIEKFARYGFNKAHTVEYGHICYHNAYLKAHYPDCFYCAILNSLTDKPDKQTLMIKDMLDHDVKLLPPDINESDVDFVMIDKMIVRFGLGAIKNFGKSASVVMADRNELGRYGCVEEFRIRISASDLNKTVMENLAKCGAFDTLLSNNSSDTQFDCRATLVSTIPDMCDKLNKLRRKKPKSDVIPTAEEALDKWENGAGTFTVTKSEDDPIQYSVWEKEVLKYYISSHPIKEYVDEIRRWGAIQNTDDEFLPEEVYIAGFVESCHETVIKKEGRNKGKKMGFITIGTAYRTYEATMFPGIYESCLPYIKAGNPVVMKCKKDFYKNSVSLQCEYIRQMKSDGIRDCPECHIRLNTYDDIFAQMKLKQIFDSNFGNTKVFIHIIEEMNDIEIELDQKISLNDYVISNIESMGKLAYKYEALDIEEDGGDIDEE